MSGRRPLTLSLRTVLLLPVLAAAVYAGGLSLFLFQRVGSAASALGLGAEEAVGLLDDLSKRHDALDHATTLADRAMRHGRVGPGLVADTLRRLATTAGVRAGPANFAILPPELRVTLARTDEAMSNLAGALTELAALFDLGNAPRAASRLAAADSLHDIVDGLLAQDGVLVRQELLRRQQALRAATGSALRVAAAWLLVGVVLLPLVVAVVRARIAVPLKDLEAGLARVADGDLTTEVRVHRADETGRLAQHFNEMTQVLRGRAEEQGRFAAAGELLAGVAHEVNNPLMAIAAHAENRLADSSVEGEQRNEMTQILRQARRATKLLRGLLRFVRATEREVTRVNLNDVVRGALDLVSYRFGVDEITVGGGLDPSLPSVEGDAIKLEQVVVNLLSNAIDALRARKPPRHLTVDTAVVDGRVSVAVADNGGGVPAEVVAQVFRPFATTKGRRGTGLGLYISRQIAREAGGELSLVSAPGEGARFLLSLPAVTELAARQGAAEAAPPASPASPAPPVPSGPLPAAPPEGAVRPVASLAGLRVLIVDDEDGIRRPMARFLKRRGAEVDEAGDGQEGLARLAGPRPDVILADLRMPRMGGVEFYARLEDGQPDLAARVLFLSGDISQLAEPGNTPVARERVLVKPVELAELERRILEFVRRSPA
jgi:signal transduction histidine kinase